MSRGPDSDDRDADAPKETMWQGKYVRAIKQGRWEYVSRTNEVRAVVIIAEHEDKLVLVEQFRFPIGARCLELPAGLVGDEDDLGVEETALKELEEETGFIAEQIERLGRFHSSPGMVAEGFDLVRAHAVAPGGDKSEEDIEVHLVEREEVADFIEMCRQRGLAVDAKLLLLLGGSIL